MSDLKSLFAETSLTKEAIVSLITSLIDNPMSIMAKVSELELPPDFLQRAMGIVMSNPAAVAEFAQSLGLSQELVDEAKSKLAAMMPGG